jgi:hypothetical protein
VLYIVGLGSHKKSSSDTQVHFLGRRILSPQQESCLKAVLSDSLPVRLTLVDLKVGQDGVGLRSRLNSFCSLGYSISRTVTQVLVCS